MNMYIDITIDLTHYNGSVFDLRLSDYHSVKKVIDIARQAQHVSVPPREGYWIRVVNKETVFPENKSYLTAALRTETALKFYERTWWNDRS
ncbi:putative ubiquitin-like protein YukD [Bacillus licheniformis]|nr:putative ubiquitin-like protein YukD [Bacillus licheniformis]